MRKVFFLAAATMLIGVMAKAQDTPYALDRGSVGYIGYSFLSVDSVAPGGRQDAHGAQTAATYRFAPGLGFTFDVGGQWHQRSPAEPVSSSFQYLAGPEVAGGVWRTIGFAHALFGAMTVRGGPDAATNFAMGFGGGMDLRATPRLAIRAFQFDYIPRRFAGEWRDNYRVSGGIVFHQ